MRRADVWPFDVISGDSGVGRVHAGCAVLCVSIGVKASSATRAHVDPTRTAHTPPTPHAHPALPHTHHTHTAHASRPQLTHPHLHGAHTHTHTHTHTAHTLHQQHTHPTPALHTHTPHTHTREVLSTFIVQHRHFALVLTFPYTLTQRAFDPQEKRRDARRTQRESGRFGAHRGGGGGRVFVAAGVCVKTMNIEHCRP